MVIGWQGDDSEEGAGKREKGAGDSRESEERYHIQLRYLFKEET